jgi:hypothetical protein
MVLLILFSFHGVEKRLVAPKTFTYADSVSVTQFPSWWRRGGDTRRQITMSGAKLSKKVVDALPTRGKAWAICAAAR